MHIRYLTKHHMRWIIRGIPPAMDHQHVSLVRILRPLDSMRPIWSLGTLFRQWWWSSYFPVLEDWTRWRKGYLLLLSIIQMSEINVTWVLVNCLLSLVLTRSGREWLKLIEMKKSGSSLFCNALRANIWDIDTNYIHKK